MDEPWLLSEAQMRRIELYFPLSHGVARVDDRRMVHPARVLARRASLSRRRPALQWFPAVP